MKNITLLTVLLFVVSCSGKNDASFKVELNGVIVEGGVKPGAVVTAKEYKAGITGILKK